VERFWVSLNCGLPFLLPNPLSCKSSGILNKLNRQRLPIILSYIPLGSEGGGIVEQNILKEEQFKKPQDF